MNRVLARRIPAELHSDPSRVVARLFLPGEEPHLAHSRASTIAARVLALDEQTVEWVAARLCDDFGARHRDYPRLLERNAAVVVGHVEDPAALSHARRLVLGASFTAEYATEAAALCNPSAFLHPDQSGLGLGQARIAVSLRAIGEGHVSSISFCAAVVGPGPQWSFSHRDAPIVPGEVSAGQWRTDQLRAVLEDQGSVDELTNGLLRALPPRFGSGDLEHALTRLSADLLTRPGAQASVDLVRMLVASAYEVTFPEDTMLAQRTLRPSVAEESGGMEDARFTRFIADDGSVDYRATYTAYDGHQIAPRLLITADLLTFRTHRLSGPAAHNKGMAVFPRLVGGRHLALCRTDGESIGLTHSADGYAWARPRLIHMPAQAWELVQVGNCGPPIETERGWLVLTHGVGPMRTYAIGALLLDIDDPSVVIGRLSQPLLEAARSEQDGYVPNVVYSCGGFVHDGRLWLPYGIDDSRIGVAWVALDELLTQLISTG